MVQRSFAVGSQRRHHLRDDRGERHDNVCVSSGAEDDAEVLMMQVHSESWLEISGEHRSRLAFQDATARQSPRHDLERTLDGHAI